MRNLGVIHLLAEYWQNIGGMYGRISVLYIRGMHLIYSLHQLSVYYRWYERCDM